MHKLNHSISYLPLYVSAARVVVAEDRAFHQLWKQANATQLIVAGKPFIVSGGETGNSIASSTIPVGDEWNTKAYPLQYKRSSASFHL